MKKETKKRLISGLLASATLLTFTACNGNGESAQTTDPNAGETTPVEDVEPNALMSATGEGLATFNNPLLTPSSENAWPGYGFGDPFVMRYNGTYYLYVSTKDGEIGIKCWSSPDLVNWTYEGKCASERLTTGAYAPEVVYYNGYFYMYTSPAGNGHYVLRSSSPTGPFRSVTENFGHSIDGDVFIDTNGKWYFYCAAGGGIRVYPMSSPSKVSDDGSQITATDMNGWTEGSMVIYYDGYYYITYTGNHVWCNGYRINYASSSRSCTSFTEAVNNPILVNTESKEVLGIGHSSTVLGPNLDSYYIVYHSSLGAPKRQTNIDRIVFNEKELSVLGPTENNQQAPELPDVYNYFNDVNNTAGWTFTDAQVGTDLYVADGGKALTEAAFEDDYTVEVNVLTAQSQAGMIFGYTDENNYGSAYFDVANQTLVITFVVDGVATTQSKNLVKSFNEDYNFNALHSITLYKSGDEYTFLVDSRELVTCKFELAAGKIGVGSVGGSATFGFVGATGDVWQSSIKDYYKPVSGNLEAITCVEKQITTVSVGKTKFVTMDEGRILNYKVNVGDSVDYSLGVTGTYDLTVKYRSTVDTVIEVYQNEVLLTTVTLPASGEKTVCEVVRQITLTEGFSVISFKVVSGSVNVKAFVFTENIAVEALDLNYAKLQESPTYKDGDWSLAGGVLSMGGGNSSVGKYLYGEEEWGDYSAEVKIKVDPSSSEINGGLLVRASNPSVGGAGNDVAAGTNFVQGYYIGLSNRSVVLGKINYEYDALASATVDTIQKGNTYNLKVEVVGNNIKVYFEGELVIDYTDNDNPFVSGMAGFRCHNCMANFDDFKLTPIA